MESFRSILNANVAWVTLTLTVAVLALIVICVLLWSRLRRIETRYALLTSDTHGGSLAQILEEQLVRLRTEMDRIAAVDTLARDLERSGRLYLQRIGFLRFNPFRDVGGDQSFSVAMTDKDGNGVVLSALHSRDVTRVYAKSLARWQSAHTLTDEERQVVAQARGGPAAPR